LLLVLLARLALGAAYAFVVPPYEAYDEDGHFAYVRYLAVNRHLLVPGDPEAEKVWEKFQPPLYYILMAPAIAWLDLGEAWHEPAQNPYFHFGNAGYNRFVQPAEPTAVEARQHLAVRILRLVGVVLSTLSVIPVHLVARRIWARSASTAWLATLLYAFWPQFLFNGSMVTNDLLVVVVTAAWFYAVFVLATDGVRLRYALSVGVLLAAGLLTKLTALALLVPTAAALVVAMATHVKGARARLRLVGVSLLIAALALLAFRQLTSLTFVTGQVFHGETIARFLDRLPNIAQPAETTDTTFALFAAQYAVRTFFAVFGWGNLETVGWAYAVAAGAAALALAGLAIFGWRLLAQRPGLQAGHTAAVGAVALIIPTTFGLSVALALAEYSVYLVVGRYLLPALPAVCVLLVLGWRAVLPARWRLRAWQALAIGLLLLGWSVPFKTLAPAYARPRALDGEPAVSVDFRYGQAIRLLGYQPADPIHPGDLAVITLCWRAEEPIAGNYPVLLELIGLDGQGHGTYATYPGGGNYATSQWQVGVPFCDRYRLQTSLALPAPAIGWVRVSLLETPDPNGPRLPVFDASGAPIDPLSAVVPLTVRSAAPTPPPRNATDYRIGDEMRLRGYDLLQLPDGRVQVNLHWEALRDLDRDYEIFVHLRDTPLTAYAQGDGPPRGGWYPTWLWQKGELIVDEHFIELPPGPSPELSLYIGVADRALGIRQPAYDAKGQRLPDDEIVLEAGLRY
jgi:hypothetical protein